jgi:hypothetical protein
VLGHSNVVSYLVETGLVDRDAMAAGGLQVRDASGRNRVFVVAGRATAGYVVKQSDLRDRELLAREAAVLRNVVAAEPRLARCIPVPVSYDARHSVLVSEVAGDAIDLSAYHDRGRFPPTLARAVGGVLALLHGLGPHDVDEFPLEGDAAFLGLPGNPPSLETVLGLSDAGVRLLRALQGSTELCERLAELEGSWHRASIVHGDVRPSNCVAVARPGARRRTRIVLVDWETARAGDPHLDLGTVFGEYLHTWLWSIWMLDGRDLVQAPRYARHPLRAMQPAIRAFWDTYLDARQGQGAGPRPSLRRAVEFSAGHLVAVAFQRAQTESTLDPRTGVALQLSLNVLRRPTEAAVHLLGLPAAEATA